MNDDFRCFMERAKRRGDPGIVHVGIKPRPGQSVQYICITGTGYAFRMWDGGLEDLGHWCLDYFDLTKNVASRVPKGYAFYPVDSYGQPMSDYPQLQTLEEALGLSLSTLPPGAEKYSVPEGSKWRYSKSDIPVAGDFYFEVPRRERPRVGMAFNRSMPGTA